MRPLAVSQAQQSESFFESLSCLSPCCAEEFGDSDESYSGSYAISCLEWHQEAGGGKTFCLSSFLEVTCTSSPQSFGEPAGVGSSGSPKCVRIFRIGPGWRTGSPPQPEVANSAKARDGFALVKKSERDQPDVAATPRALQRKLLTHARHQFRPRNPRRGVRAGLARVSQQPPATGPRRACPSCVASEGSRPVMVTCPPRVGITLTGACQACLRRRNIE
jgi:hypothetical protein